MAFRVDATFAKSGTDNALGQRDVDNAIRMPASQTFELEIDDIRFRPSDGRAPADRAQALSAQGEQPTLVGNLTKTSVIAGRLTRHRRTLPPVASN